MKIGIISDIHAQYDSLEKALTILKEKQVDEIICAGDLVNRGNDGEKVVRYFQKNKIPCVLGNHDEASSISQKWYRDVYGEKTIQVTFAKYDQSDFIKSLLLSDGVISFLENLPFQLEFERENKRILMVHGSPQSNVQYIMHKNSDKFILSMIGDADADIIICGHTHQVMYRRVGDYLILNPGSVCQSNIDSSSHTCAILTLPEIIFEVYSIETGTQLEKYP